MKRVVLGYQNRIDSAVLSGGNWQAPLSNLQTRFLQQRARSTDVDLSSTIIGIDLQQDRPISMFAIAAHSISIDGKYRLTAGTAAGLSDLLDSGWLDVWPAVYATESLEWEDDNFWDGRLSEEDREGYNACIVLETPITRARYWRIEIDDTVSNTAGYIELGRVFLGRRFIPERSVEVGGELAWNDKSEITQSLQQVDIYNKIQMYRSATVSMPVLSQTDAMSGAFELMRTAGTTEEILFIGNADEPSEMLRQSFLGRFERLSPVKAAHYNLFATTFEIKELI